MAWFDVLLPASWRGIPFSVRGTEYGGGRRTAVHTYPYRDTIWVEDLGRYERRVTFSAFVVGDDCYLRAQLLLKASEIAGPGILVHPSLGVLRVATVAPVRMLERAEKGRVVELQFEFAETDDLLSPVFKVLNTLRLLSTASLSSLAIFAGYQSALGIAILQGVAVASAVQGTVQSWVARVTPLSEDAAITTNAVAGLQPVSGSYGRYSTGRRGDVLLNAASAPEALSAILTARSVIQEACQAAVAAALATLDKAFGAAIDAVTEALRLACNDPADAVRLLSALARFDVEAQASAAPVGQAIATAQIATAALCRQAAICSLARACATYQPTSYDDAMAVRDTVAAIIDREVLSLGEASSGSQYLALSDLRAALIEDLNERGAKLPGLRTVATVQSQPSLVLGYQLYADSRRADELTRRADPPHPGFMPLEFQALSG